uniref:F-box domain-containing protein n=1 Tax=Moniliophthora roreri TaxID=221103 RepID=A0A0W0FT79_MONRR
MDRVLSRLLVIEGHSRVSLSPSDRLTVTQHLYRAEEEIRKWEYETKKLVAEILSLDNRRRGLQKSIDLYRSVLSPVQRMPTEMLSSIFAFCCEKNELSSPRRLPVMSLSMVCARWRDIVLSTPWLWSKLDIDIECPYPSKNKILSMTQITQLFMQRSQNAPLTWSLDHYHIAPLLPVLRPLLQNSERWRSINLCVDDDLFDEPAFTSISGRIPMLERLKLYASDDILHRQLDMFAVAPALSMVDCTPIYLHNMALPWSQIRNLTLRNSYTPESLFVLSQCPNLEELELDRIGSELTTETTLQVTTPITLPKVHTLSIICDANTGEDDFVFAFEFLTLPSLSFIALGSDSGSGWEGIS